MKIIRFYKPHWWVISLFGWNITLMAYPEKERKRYDELGRRAVQERDASKRMELLAERAKIGDRWDLI